ncbi:hypothetical protein [Nocardia sp. NPDC057353]|uniref:hypothetical protein n=1 Tax=Nocardia sp. NPDC057353 TaxID=3346104 RepID=UPI003635597B
MADWPTTLVSRPFTPADSATVGTWRYFGRWQVYDLSPAATLSADDGYTAIADALDGTLIGFFCTGIEARVPGLAPRPGVTDIGIGLAPCWTGRGHGHAFGTAVLAAVGREQALRAVVQEWSLRSRRFLHRLGFTETGEHRCVQMGRTITYTVLLRTRDQLTSNVYSALDPITRDEATAAMRSTDRRSTVEAILRLSLHDPDPAWATTRALELTESPDCEVRGAAATASGHIARLHGGIDRERVIPALRRLAADPATAGRAADALDDISMFTRRSEMP